MDALIAAALIGVGGTLLGILLKWFISRRSGRSQTIYMPNLEEVLKYGNVIPPPPKPSERSSDDGEQLGAYVPSPFDGIVLGASAILAWLTGRSRSTLTRQLSEATQLVLLLYIYSALEGFSEFLGAGEYDAPSENVALRSVPVLVRAEWNALRMDLEWVLKAAETGSLEFVSRGQLRASGISVFSFGDSVEQLARRVGKGERDTLRANVAALRGTAHGVDRDAGAPERIDLMGTVGRLQKLCPPLARWYASLQLRTEQCAAWAEESGVRTRRREA